MAFTSKAFLIAAALALAACSSAGRFEGPGAGASVAGTAQDPSSPLYFQQAVGDRVLFAVDQSTLSPEAMAILDGQARWLLQNGGFNVRIEGHADERGTREYNLALGARRANAVREYLVSKGVPAGRIDTVSYGKERPVELCSEERCNAKNRRAVTVVSAGAVG
ncbi:MAG: peptidoglycan-associated lipoprotein Pal [Roseovarius sp.]